MKKEKNMKSLSKTKEIEIRYFKDIGISDFKKAIWICYGIDSGNLKPKNYWKSKEKVSIKIIGFNFSELTGKERELLKEFRFLNKYFGVEINFKNSKGLDSLNRCSPPLYDYFFGKRAIRENKLKKLL